MSYQFEFVDEHSGWEDREVKVWIEDTEIEHMVEDDLAELVRSSGFNLVIQLDGVYVDDAVIHVGGEVAISMSDLYGRIEDSIDPPLGYELDTFDPEGMETAYSGVEIFGTARVRRLDS